MRLVCRLERWDVGAVFGEGRHARIVALSVDPAPASRLRRRVSLAVFPRLNFRCTRTKSRIFSD